MKVSESVIVKLRDTFTQVESDGSLDECVQELSAMVGYVLNAKNCAILLLSEEDVEQFGLNCGTEFGNIPGLFDAPDTASESNYNQVQMDKMFSTICVNKKVIGVIHVFEPQDHIYFNHDDLQLFSILTPLITKSIQVIQLRNLLKSRFAQMALTRSNDKTIRELISGVSRNPNQVARILAKSFYREMLNAGFNFNQIIYAATEVISELTASLRKHSEQRKQRFKQGQAHEPMLSQPAASKPLGIAGSAPGGSALVVVPPQ